MDVLSAMSTSSSSSSSASAAKSRIVVADMDDKLQSDVVEAAERIFKEQAEKGGNVREVASALKTHMDAAHSKKWHVVVGSSFGSAVDALSRCFIHFYYGDVAFLVFRTT